MYLGADCTDPGTTYNATYKKCVRPVGQSCPVNNPVVPHQGDKVVAEIDIQANGRTWFARAYRSRAIYLHHSAMGENWRHQYENLLVTSSTRLAAYRYDGTVQYFDRVSSTWVASRADVRDTVVDDGSGGFILTRAASQDQEFYASSGRYLAIETRGGQRFELNYDGNGSLDSVNDETGREMTFTYAVGGLLETATGPSGEQVHYTYLGVGSADTLPFTRLETVRYGNPTTGPVRTYHYESTTFAHVLTGITDENGQRYSKYTYDSTGRVSQTVLTGSASNNIGVVGYSYPTTFASGTTGTTVVVDPLGTSRTYSFDLVQGVGMPSGISQPCTSCGGSNAQAITYDARNNPETKTDFLGTVTWLEHDSTRNLETIRIEAQGKDTLPDRARSDERKTETSWDSTWRLPVERKVYYCDAPNNTTQACSTASNARWTLEGKQTWTYNSRGQLLTSNRIDPAASVTTQTVTRTWCELADGDFGTETCPLVGRVKTINGARTDVSDVSTYRYYDADHASCSSAPTTCPYHKGDLKSVTNALGHVTTFSSYDGAGRVLRTVDPNGVITDQTYHPRGWLATRTVRANSNGTANATYDAVTTYDYEDYGEISRVTQPDGTYIEFERDQAHRITALEDNLGNRIEYTLDGAGNRTHEKTYDPSNTLKRNLKRDIDTLGRLSKLYNANETDYTELQYDANSNAVESIDPLGNITAQAYDPLNRLIETLQDKPAASSPDAADPGTTNATTSYDYDALDRQTQVIDPNKLVTGYAYDGLGQLDTLASPDTGITAYGQDSAGNRSSETDAVGNTRSYSYDALNRLTQIAYTAASGITDPGDTTFQYDQADGTTGCSGSFPKGRLTRMIDASGTTTYCYDLRGNLTRKTWVDAESRSHVTGYGWTLADRVASITYPSGAVVTYSRDSVGRISSVNRTVGGTTSTLASGVSYLPFGPLAGLTFGNSETLAKAYDQDYRIDSVTGSDLTLDFTTDASGDIVRIDQTTASTTSEQRYVYDDLHRLTEVRALNQTPIDVYTYDPTGNRLSHTAGSGSAVNYDYDNTPSVPVLPGDPNYGLYSHRLQGVGSDTRSYDDNGNTITGASTSVDLEFDAANRMETAVDTLVSGSSRAYAYNGRSERSRKIDSAGGTHLLTHYDESGQTIELTTWTNATPPVLTKRVELVWIDSTPIAAVETTVSGGSSTVRLAYLATDHLNSPRLAREAGTGTVWRWNMVLGNTSSGGSNAFGEQAASGVGGTPLALDLRFPGQLYDAESGLHYNYFRDYEPGVGRYVESDPIGLRGGLNTFRYANAAPLSFSDAHGLSTSCGENQPEPCLPFKKGSDNIKYCAKLHRKCTRAGFLTIGGISVVCTDLQTACEMWNQCERPVDPPPPTPEDE